MNTSITAKTLNHHAKLMLRPKASSSIFIKIVLCLFFTAPAFSIENQSVKEKNGVEVSAREFGEKFRSAVIAERNRMEKEKRALYYDLTAWCNKQNIVGRPLRSVQFSVQAAGQVGNFLSGKENKNVGKNIYYGGFTINYEVISHSTFGIYLKVGDDEEQKIVQVTSCGVNNVAL